MWAYLIVSYLYLEKMGLSRIIFQLYYNLLYFLTNVPIFNCVNFRNGDCRKFSGLIFASVGQMTKITPISYVKWGYFTDNLPISTTM